MKTYLSTYSGIINTGSTIDKLQMVKQDDFDQTEDKSLIKSLLSTPGTIVSASKLIKDKFGNNFLGKLKKTKHPSIKTHGNLVYHLLGAIQKRSMATIVKLKNIERGNYKLVRKFGIWHSFTPSRSQKST